MKYKILVGGAMGVPVTVVEYLNGGGITWELSGTNTLLEYPRTEDI